MSSAKGQLYSSSLDLARRLDLFSSQTPVDAHGRVNRVPGAAAEGMPWKELLRKFTKHNPHREVTAQAAAADQTIHALLSKAARAAKYHLDRSHASDIPSPSTSTFPFAPPSLASAPLIRTEDRPVALVALEALVVSIQHGQGTEVEKNSAKIVKAYGLYALGDFAVALGELSGVNKEAPNGGWESYDLTLAVLANLVEGYANERLAQFAVAQTAYGRASRVYDDSTDILAKSGGTKDDVTLNHHGEDAMYRSALWSRSTPGTHTSFPPHRLYVKHTRHWPIAFRPTKALVVRRSLRDLLHEIGPLPAAPANWYAEVSANNQAEEAILRNTTSLPPAGEVNKPYLDFLDDVAEGWRIGGSRREGAAEVVDILYNALTHTFQSQRLLRHLVRVLTTKGSYSEAGKALKLYVELFDKARETDAAQVARDVRKFRGKAHVEKHHHEKTPSEGGGEKAPAEAEEEEEPVDLEEDFDIDSDRDFVRTLTFGTRVFCKYLDDPAAGLKLAKRARAVFDEKKDPALAADKSEESRIERALGVALGALTAKDADVETRPTYHKLALKHLETAAELDPSSWETLYHLSYQLAELRRISPALEKAREAVRLNGSSRDCWHLLGLLVGAQKDLGASLQVLETALDYDDDDDDDDDEVEAGEEATASNGSPSAHSSLPPAVNVRKVNGSSPTFLAPVVHDDVPATSGNGNGTHVEGGGSNGPLLPLAAAASDVNLPRDETELLVSELQIRMTKNLVIEAMEGPGAALLDQQGLMAYFSQAYAEVRQQPELPPKVDLPTPEPTVRRASSLLGRKRGPRSSAGPNGDSTLGASLRVPSSAISVATRNSSVNLTPPSILGHGVSDSVTSLEELPSSPHQSGPTIETNPRATKLLVDIWLMTAASFRRAGQLDNARGAIQEAESLDGDNPDVWVQFALYNLATSSPEAARTSFVKALAYDLNHIGANVLLARLYLAGAPAKVPYAEGLLDTLTKRYGWDVPEAWFELSRCYKATGRPGREKECLVWALQLEETRSVRALGCLPRLL